jgi:hypothetical protein
MRTHLIPLIATAYMSGDLGTTIKSPVGRIVWGHPCKSRPATDNNNLPKLDKDGKQLMEVSFGLAIPEAEFHAQVWPAMAAEIQKGFPNGIPGNFSYKMTQPHEIDNKGKPYAEREGYAGHVVLAVSTVLEAPPVFQWTGTQWAQMQSDAIKCGDYVQVEINFKVNVPTKPTHTPSVYVNPRQIAFVGYGTEIKSGFQADPNATFGAGPAALPAGASATPIGGAPAVGMPGAPGNPAMPATMPGAPSALPVAAASPPPVAPAIPAGPQRPLDPTHIHDNGNGTEQWFVNGAWDGGAHPAPGAAPAAPALPPPATGFVQQAAGMPGAPVAGMPGMPGAMPPR